MPVESQRSEHIWLVHYKDISNLQRPSSREWFQMPEQSETKTKS